MLKVTILNFLNAREIVYKIKKAVCIYFTENVCATSRYTFTTQRCWPIVSMVT